MGFVKDSYSGVGVYVIGWGRIIIISKWECFQVCCRYGVLTCNVSNVPSDLEFFNMTFRYDMTWSHILRWWVRDVGMCSVLMLIDLRSVINCSTPLLHLDCCRSLHTPHWGKSAGSDGASDGVVQNATMNCCQWFYCTKLRGTHKFPDASRG